MYKDLKFFEVFTKEMSRIRKPKTFMGHLAQVKCGYSNSEDMGRLALIKFIL